jgi:transcriptional regulator with XRE-family HTH domain
MADRLGISQNYLSLLENNRAEPSLSLLRRISQEFGVPLSFLFLESVEDYESDDPEINELLQEFKSLVHTLQQSRIARRDGKDWETELRQRAKEKQLMKELGLSEAQAQPEQPSQDDEKDDTDAPGNEDQRQEA